jgi:hypothetical protein
VERNLFWVTDGTYQSAFLTTDEGVVVFDAPPTIGHNLRRAVDETRSMPNKWIASPVTPVMQAPSPGTKRCHGS